MKAAEIRLRPRGDHHANADAIITIADLTVRAAVYRHDAVDPIAVETWSALWSDGVAAKEREARAWAENWMRRFER